MSTDNIDRDIANEDYQGSIYPPGWDEPQNDD